MDTDFFLYSDFGRTKDLRFLVGYPPDPPDHYTYPLDICPHPVTHPPTHPYFPHFSLLTLCLSSFLSFHIYIFFFFTFHPLSLSSVLSHGFSLPPSLSLSLFSVLSPASLSFTVTILLSTHNHGLTQHRDFDGIFSTEWSESIQVRSHQI